MRLALGKKEFMCLVVLETGTDNLAEFRIVTFSKERLSFSYVCSQINPRPSYTNYSIM